jgi:micrococcal nuclease
MTRNFVLALLLLTLSAVNAGAATIFGRVIAINDGDVLTVFNLNRPVRIKLLAVDAPESDQAFGEVAKKHLTELIYDKSVLVEYSGIAPDGSLVGRVTLNGADIGAQMIRDGAAWFDASGQDRLSVADREVYQQSEQAARSEKRGLWQAENPIAPWEFVRAKTLRREPVASLNSVTPAVRSAKQPGSVLTNLTLMRTGSTSATPAPARVVEPDMAWAADNSPKQWRLFKPPGENFSAEMPAGGASQKIPEHLDDGSGGTVDLNVYKVRDGDAIYAALWMTAPFVGEADRTALDQTVHGFLKGLSLGFRDGGGGQFSCELERETKLSLAGYTGLEYDLQSCTVPGKLRVFTKVISGQRQMYVGAAFSWREDPNISRFLRSFTVSASRTPKRTSN